MHHKVPTALQVGSLMWVQLDTAPGRALHELGASRDSARELTVKLGVVGQLPSLVAQASGSSCMCATFGGAIAVVHCRTWRPFHPEGRWAQRPLIITSTHRRSKTTQVKPGPPRVILHPLVCQLGCPIVHFEQEGPPCLHPAPTAHSIGRSLLSSETQLSPPGFALCELPPPDPT